ncbi:MAG: lysophospholipid acyltransferase family protein [Candidatus Hodarchaeales archaeon]
MGLAVPPELDDKRIFFLGKQSALWRNRFWGKMMDYFGVIPVKKRGNNLAIQKGLEVLQKNQVLGIFPEGHIKYSRKDLEGKIGVARFAFETGSPVVPVGIIGTDGVLPYGGNWPSIGKKVTLHVGEPIFLSDKFDHTDIYDPYALRAATDIIMKEIRKQSHGYGIKPLDIPKLGCMEGISTIITPKGLVPVVRKVDKRDLVNSFEECLDSIPQTMKKQLRPKTEHVSSSPNKPTSKTAEEEFLNWLNNQL